MRRPISIRINLLTYFLAIVGLVALSLIATQYNFSLKLADSAAEKTFEQVADKMGVFIQERDAQLSGIIDLVSYDNSLGKLPAAGQPHPSLVSFINVLESHPGIYALYVGDEGGDFYEVISMDSYPDMHERYQAEASARWVTIHIHGEGAQRVKQSTFLDAQLNALEERSEASRYDPRIRPWYRMALKSDQVVRTEPYLFSFLGASGITYAGNLSNGTGVLGLDITMLAMNDFLANTKLGKDSEIFLYDRYGEKYASSERLSLGAGEMMPLDITVQPIPLSDEERAFIDAKQSLRVSNENDWPPIDFAVRGVPSGYSIDYLNLVAQKTGLKLQFVNGFSWSELLELFKDGKLDLVHSAYRTEERERFALLTEPMAAIKTELVLRKGVQAKTLADLNGKTIALPSGWATLEAVQRDHPQIKLLEVPQSFDAYIAVDQGKADATIDHALSMHYLSAKYGLDNLVLGPWLKEMDDHQARHLHMLVPKDQPMLRDILNRAIASFSAEELQLLRDRWQQTACSEESPCPKNQNVVHKSFMQTSTGQSSGLIDYEEAGVRYFGHAAPISIFGDNGHRIGLVQPARHFLAPFMHQVEISLNFAIFIFLLAIPIIFSAINRINRPIRELMVENEKISRREYGKVGLIDTNIRELLDLSESMITMSQSIQAYEKAQEELMDSFIQLIADAIDAKSHYTAGHCIRVPEIAMMLARKAHEREESPFQPFRFHSEDEWREFRIGAWLHDCGKVTTPEYVVDKATKLETIYNRIHEVRTRFEVLWRDAEISCLKRQLQGEDAAPLQQWLEQEQGRLVDDFQFLAECNIGGEFMSEEKVTRLQQIAGHVWQRHFDNRLGLSDAEMRRFGDRPNETLPVQESLLGDRPEHIEARDHFDHQAYQAQGFKTPVPEHLYNYGELYNLSISRGTLTNEERFKINEHIIMTIRMLEALPLPDNLKRVPEYAGTHHETLTGSGYPRQLAGEELSMAARIMTLSDIFEALTASDRPYKKPKTLSESIKIMSFMCQDGHIDPDVFKLFLTSGIYREYAEKHLLAAQIDEVDIEPYLNCTMKPKRA